MDGDIPIGVLAAILRDDPVAAEVWTELTPERLLREAERHGVLPLLAARSASSPDAPEALRANLAAMAQDAAAADMFGESDLRGLLDALESERVPALLMKGAALAYTHYARPDLRPRLDTDVLIRSADRGRVDVLLHRLGYRSEPQVGTDASLYQRPYVRRRSGLPEHLVDVHWRLVNPEVFRDVLSFEEMAAESVRGPALGPSVRAPSAVHALLVACVHRVAHHFDEDRLIWLYDIHLLGRQLPAEAWTRFVALARGRRVSAVCLASLQRTAECFSTPVPDVVWAGLREGAATSEVTARYLVRDRPRLSIALDDLRAMPTWSSRWRLIREQVLPPAAYMRDVYAPSSATPLAWLYVRRIANGSRKWLSRSWLGG